MPERKTFDIYLSEPLPETPLVMYMWAQENLDEKCTMGWNFGNQETGSGMTFSFNNRDDALLFTLRWGGKNA